MVNNSTNTNSFFVRVRNNLYPLFWFIASSNEKILRDSPTNEQDKHFGYGMAILLTAMAAVVSGFFAFSQIIRYDDGTPKVIPALLVAILWGFLILNLDRIMVGSMKKDIQNRRRKELLPVLPRILLAAVIALVISKPIEVELLKKQIVADQAKNRQVEVYNSTSVTNQHINDSEQAIDESQKKIDRYSSESKEIEKEFPYQSMSQEYSTCITKIVSLDSKITANNDAIKSLWGDDRYSYLDDVPKGDSLGNKKPIRTLNQSGLDRRYNLNKENSSYIDEKKKLNCDRISERMVEYKKRRQSELDTASMKEKSRLAENEATLKKERGIQADLQGKNDTLFTKADEDFFGLLDDLGTLKKNNSNIWWASLLLSLLFFILEIAPIFVKWISDRGIYDELLEADEKFIRDDIRLKISESQIQVQSAIANGEAYLNADTLSNQELLSRVMEAQNVIGKKIVEEWQNSELEKLQYNREGYLKDHIVQH